MRAAERQASAIVLNAGTAQDRPSVADLRRFMGDLPRATMTLQGKVVQDSYCKVPAPGNVAVAFRYDSDGRLDTATITVAVPATCADLPL